MDSTKNTIKTDNADMITHHAYKNDKLPPMHYDQLAGKVVADLPAESQQEFYADVELQRFLSVKKQVWRIISKLRQRAAGGSEC
jgi:hypothetical protein